MTNANPRFSFGAKASSSSNVQETRKTIIPAPTQPVVAKIPEEPEAVEMEFEQDDVAVSVSSHEAVTPSKKITRTPNTTAEATPQTPRKFGIAVTQTTADKSGASSKAIKEPKISPTVAAALKDAFSVIMEHLPTLQQMKRLKQPVFDDALVTVRVDHTRVHRNPQNPIARILSIQDRVTFTVDLVQPESFTFEVDGDSELVLVNGNGESENLTEELVATVVASYSTAS